jgi:hypothetical protein
MVIFIPEENDIQFEFTHHATKPSSLRGVMPMDDLAGIPWG